MGHTFAFIHGAWHGAWCWSEVLPRLDAAGHRGVAFDLPGHGNDPAPEASATLDGYVERVLQTVQPIAPLVLVAHSMGGIAALGALNAAPDLFSGAIFVAAFAPAPGEAILTYARSDTQSQLPDAMRVDRERGVAHLVVDQLDFFYDEAPPALARNALKRLRPQALAPMATPVAWSPDNVSRTSLAYIATTGDKVVGPDVQARMHGNLPSPTVVTMQAGHFPFMSVPDEFVAFLLKVAPGSG